MSTSWGTTKAVVLSFYKQSSATHVSIIPRPPLPFSSLPDLPMSWPVPPWKFLHAWPASCFNFLAVFFSNFSNTRPPWVFVSNLPTLLSVYATCFFQDRITLSKACPSTVNAVDHFLLLGTFSSQFPWYYILLRPLCPWPLLLAPSQAHFLLPSWLSLKVEISQRGWMSLENQQAGHLLTNPFRASPKSTGHSWSPWRGAQGLLVLWLPAFLCQTLNLQAILSAHHPWIHLPSDSARPSCLSPAWPHADLAHLLLHPKAFPTCPNVRGSFSPRISMESTVCTIHWCLYVIPLEAPLRHPPWLLGSLLFFLTFIGV